MTSLNIATRAWRRFGILLTLCLSLAGANPAAASVIYDFSLPSNGSVGAVDIQLTFATFFQLSGHLITYNLSSGAPVTSVSSGTTLDAAGSIVGFEVDAFGINNGITFFGVDLVAPNSSTVLYTPTYSSDFFLFSRAANQTGTFTGTGSVTSSLPLDTAHPTATLVVADTSAAPEPGTASLLGCCLIGIAGWQMRRLSA